MKRFHVHLHVDDLQASIAFYSQAVRRRAGARRRRLRQVDARGPARSTSRSRRAAASPASTTWASRPTPRRNSAELKARAEAADMALLDEGATTCCYARSEKHWITDPQGIAWEHFHTLGDIPVFSETATPARRRSRRRRRAASPRGKPVGIAVKAGSCC